jgi:hypothetical protein
MKFVFALLTVLTLSTSAQAAETKLAHCIDGLSAQMDVYTDDARPNYVRVENVGHDLSQILSASLTVTNPVVRTVRYYQEGGLAFELNIGLDGFSTIHSLNMSGEEVSGSRRDIDCRLN